MENNATEITRSAGEPFSRRTDKAGFGFGANVTENHDSTVRPVLGLPRDKQLRSSKVRQSALASLFFCYFSRACLAFTSLRCSFCAAIRSIHTCKILIASDASAFRGQRRAQCDQMCVPDKRGAEN